MEDTKPLAKWQITLLVRSPCGNKHIDTYVMIT